ncbi:MAG: EAL domain-containing protein [Aquificae bacterium]|nr:EAL domain-containing protein [Aquificota bacterium]
MTRKGGGKFLPPEKLEKIRAYINLTDKDLKNLERVAERFSFRDAYELFKSFSEHLLKFDEFKRAVKERGVDLEELRKRRAEYFLRLLKDRYDEEYLESRLRVGMLHSEAKVTLDYFIGSLGKLTELLLEKLREKFPEREASELFLSVLKAFFFDVALIVDAYVYETFEKFKEFLDKNVDAIVLLTPDFRVAFANKTFYRLTGLKPEQVEGKELCELIPKDQQKLCTHLLERVRNEETGTLEEPVYFTNALTGVRVPVEIAFNKLRLQDERFVVLDIRDISERLKAQREYELVSFVHSVITEIDKAVKSEPDYRKSLETFVRLLVEKGGYRFAGLYRNETERPLYWHGTADEAPYSACLRSYCNEDCLVLVLSKNEPFFKGEINALQEFFNDLIHHLETRRFSEKLAEKSTYDELTGLYGRSFFLRHLEDLLKSARLKGRKVAVVVFDIDYFTEINTVYGHGVGDEVLKEVARRLSELPQLGGSLARISGDTFAFAVEFAYSKEEVLEVIKEVQRLFSKPVKVNGYEVYLTFSFGISVFPDDGEKPQELLSFATTAMMEARKLGGGTFSFYRFPEHEIREKIRIKHELKKALEREEFTLYYQPKVSLKDRTVVGVEALLRWKKGDAFVPPAYFIPILEEMGLIGELGLWTLNRVCSQLEQWLNEGLELKVAVNVSPAQLRSTSHVRALMQKIRSCELLHRYLEVEITETAVVENFTLSQVFLSSLADLGVRSYIDDFGKGYSSLVYLKKLPVYGLKIDVAFVHNIPEDRENAEIVKTIISLAKSFQLKTVAEGVEREAQERVLKEMGCDYAQGFYYAPPLPPEEVVKFVKRYEGSPHGSGV